MSWNGCKFPWWLSIHWPRCYPSVYQGSKKSRKALREYPDIKEPHQRKKTKKTLTESRQMGYLMLGNVYIIIKIDLDFFRWKTFLIQPCLARFFLCYLFLFTCFYHEIMHPFSSCFGIFSRSKACRFSIRVCEWVPQSSPVVVSRQYLQTEKPAAFYDSVQLQNKMDFCFLFFSTGVF